MGVNIDREKILRKGYANKNDIRKFLRVGSERAKQIYDLELAAIESEGKIVVFGIDPTRLLKYINMTKNDVFKYAEYEKKDVSS